MNKELKQHIIDWIINKKDFEYQNYITIDDTLYYQKMIKEGLIRHSYDGKILINFQSKNKNQLVKVFEAIKDLKEVHKDILLVMYMFADKERLPEEEIIKDDFLNMVTVYSEGKLFYMFKKLNLDFKDFLLNYITYYRVGHLFDQVYDQEIYDDPNNDRISRKLLGKDYNDHYWGGHWGMTDDYIEYNIKDDTIRNEIFNLKRTLKIKSFLLDIEDDED